jgi:tetratricopeptide (TPR) repeat protein
LGWKDNVDGKEDWAVVDESVENARRTGDPWAISWCLKFAYSHLKRPDLSLSQKRVALEEAISLAQKTKDPFLISQGLNGMGNVFSWNGELNAAEGMYLDSMRLAREINDSWSILNNINCLADGYLGLGRFDKAKELYNEGLRLAVDLGARGYMAWFVGGFYILARHEGLNKRALRLGAFSESILNPDSRYNPRFAEELGLDGEAAEAVWNIGRSMSPEQAVAYAFYDE